MEDTTKCSNCGHYFERYEEYVLLLDNNTELCELCFWKYAIKKIKCNRINMS